MRKALISALLFYVSAQECDADYDPVCANDMHVYSNVCFMEAHDASLSIIKGPCKAEHAFNPAEAGEVCGSDHLTYRSQCVLDVHVACGARDLSVLYKGKCIPRGSSTRRLQDLVTPVLPPCQKRLQEAFQFVFWSDPCDTQEATEGQNGSSHCSSEFLTSFTNGGAFISSPPEATFSAIALPEEGSIDIIAWSLCSTLGTPCSTKDIDEIAEKLQNALLLPHEEGIDGVHNSFVHHVEGYGSQKSSSVWDGDADVRIEEVLLSGEEKQLEAKILEAEGTRNGKGLEVSVGALNACGCPVPVALPSGQCKGFVYPFIAARVIE